MLWGRAQTCSRTPPGRTMCPTKEPQLNRVPAFQQECGPLEGPRRFCKAQWMVAGGLAGRPMSHAPSS